MEFLHSFLGLFQEEGMRAIITQYGLPLICLIIFAETGIFPLLPGDSLLFLCGIYAATLGADGQPVLSLAQLLMVVPLCGILGDQVGYSVGRWAGKSAYRWKEKKLWIIPIYKPAYLTMTKDFYERWGVFAIVASRWVPIVRTFAPILAGVTRMPYKTFVPFNVLGGISWVASMVLLGYFLPPVTLHFFPQFNLTAHIEKIILLIIFISLLPIVYTIMKERSQSKKLAPRAKRASKKK